MVSKKLYRMFVLSIPLFVLHGWEEYATGFYAVDPFARFAFGPLTGMSNPQATFLLFQILLWMLMIISAVLMSGEKWRLRLMILPGMVYVFELHHVVHMAIWGRYYPGTATSLAFPIIGLFFWKEWLRCRAESP